MAFLQEACFLFHGTPNFFFHSFLTRNDKCQFCPPSILFSVHKNLKNIIIIIQIQTKSSVHSNYCSIIKFSKGDFPSIDFLLIHSSWFNTSNWHQCISFFFLSVFYLYITSQYIYIYI